MTQPVQDPEPWDHTYKGIPYWLDFRAQVLRLLSTERAVSFSDIESDPWFQKQSHVYEPVQWERARVKLVRGRPQAADDPSDLVQFFIEGKGGRKWYVAHRQEMHCGVVIAMLKERIAKDRQALMVRNLRRQWGAEESCRACGVAITYNDIREHGYFIGPIRLRPEDSNPKPARPQAEITRE